MWKYCTDEEAIRSFHLTDGLRCKEGKEIQTLFAVSNHVEEHYHIAYIPKKRVADGNFLFPMPFSEEYRKIFCGIFWRREKFHLTQKPM